MKLKKFIFPAIFFILILFPFILWFIWKISASTQMNIFIMDKTVASSECSEHNAFNGVLTHQKYVKNNNTLYSSVENYFGFFPKEKSAFLIKDLEKYSNRQIDSLADFYSMAYYTDTYGLTKNDWFGKKEPSAFSMKLYGGLDENDVRFLEKMKEKNKLIIAEFNFLAKPTADAVRANAESLLDINWTGWTGKYFECLDTTKNEKLPDWITGLYVKQNHGNWPFKQSGIVFVNNFTLKVVVLENIIDLDFEAPQIVTATNGQDTYEVPYKMPFSGWFDITYPMDGSQEIISYYRIKTNNHGDSVMVNNKLPRVFPAIIKNKSGNIFYFCGDFCDNTESLRLLKFAGIPVLASFLSDKNNISDPSSFYWNFYFPMMKNILNDYCQTLKKN